MMLLEKLNVLTLLAAEYAREKDKAAKEELFKKLRELKKEITEGYVKRRKTY